MVASGTRRPAGRACARARTRGYSTHALDKDVVATERRYPAAVITSGVCVDPAGPKEDGYFRKRVSERASVRLSSPIDLIAAG